MPTYRLYLIGCAGHVESVEDISASNDDEAVEVSSRGRDDQRRALWCESRLIGEWNFSQPSQAAMPT